jgi:hypothetical protein
MSLTRTLSLLRRSLSYSAPRPDAAAGLSMGLRLGKWLTRAEHQHYRTEDPGPIGVQAHDRLYVVVGAQLVREVPDGQRKLGKYRTVVTYSLVPRPRDPYHVSSKR